MTALDHLTDTLTRAQRLYRAACDGALLLGPAPRPRVPGPVWIVAALPDGHWRREALRNGVRDLERLLAAEKVRQAIRMVNGTGRRRAS